MKLLKQYGFYIMLILLQFSCYKDKGNYDITPVDKISIGGPAYNQENFQVQQQDTLKIDPVYTFTGDSTKLKFKWYIMRPTVRPTDTTIRLISTEPTLRYKVQNPTGGYTVQLSIEDPSTEIVRSRTYGVSVRLRGAQGFMVLNTKVDNSQDIDVIIDNTKPDIYFGLFSSNNTFKLTDATKLTHLIPLTNPTGLVYVMRKNGGYTLRPNFELLQSAEYWFFDAPEKIQPTRIYQDAFGMNNYMLNNGKIHSTRANNAPLIFTYHASGDYAASHALLMSTYAFLFDAKNKQFLRYNKAAGRVMSIIKNPEDKFDISNIGDRSVFLFDHTMQPSTAPSAANFAQVKPIAYAKDNVTKRVYAYKIGFFRSLATYAESVTEVTAPSFAEGTAYVNSSRSPLTYYAHKNSLYVYDIQNNAVREIYKFPRTDISIDLLKTNGDQLLVGVNTLGKNEGEVYFFRLNAAGSIANDTYLSKYAGFGKVVDVEYKYNTVNMSGVAWK
ncbi:hypothetical protein E2P86_09320 [Sphingobacterium psychroaquaticum]|uniref:PKD-like family lipoprotein n=1 Tax=Sphingobacterium psychroaquaticum TaxID=561061 RepID=UPI001069CD20|nr:PKD-like family lipoprotein [Sphingobacterium psychroaquaticum]QBQ41345.1 hypothetical protein E2P86_09320 [Sphingobacterium psychroaquaticum]